MNLASEAMRHLGGAGVLSPDEIVTALIPQIRSIAHEEATKATDAAVKEVRKNVWYAGGIGGILGAILVYFLTRRRS